VYVFAPAKVKPYKKNRRPSENENGLLREFAGPHFLFGFAARSNPWILSLLLPAAAEFCFALCLLFCRLLGHNSS
jgi:hypothetical protein